MRGKFTALLLTLALTTSKATYFGSDYWSRFERDFCVNCPLNMALVRMDSYYGAKWHSVDRAYWFICSEMPDNNSISDNCNWNDALHNRFGDFDFKCGANEAIAGVESKWNSTTQDRKWSFKCCRSRISTNCNCWYTYNEQCHSPYKYDFLEEFFSLDVGQNAFVSGVKSERSPSCKDRKFAFFYCKCCN